MSENKEPLNKNNKVPKLRFPEFKDEWIKIKLCDITTRLRQKNKDNYPYLPLTISAQEGLISQFDYYDKQIASLNLSTYYIIQKGQFAYNKSYSNGYPYGAIKRLNNYDIGVLSSLYICFQLKRTNSDYICFYFDSNKWNKEVRLISGEGARNHGLLNLSANDFFNISLFIPNYLEQEKISKFLLLLYKKIELMEAKIDTLKKYKKGLQNHLFAPEGKNKFFYLIDIVTFEPKSSISAGDSIETGNFILYKSGQSNGTSNTYTHEGTYIVANDGGAASFKLANGKFSYTDHCICFKCKSEEETIVLCNYLQMNEKRITYIGFTGTGIKNIDKQYLGMLKIPELDNKKIAPVFIKIEEAINVMNDQLNSLTKMKKQLLASMFI